MRDHKIRKDITIFGHRGARGIYTENTMAGFRYLNEIGINAVELDVQNAANRVTVIAHDPYVLVPNTVNEKSCKKLIRITEAKELTKVTAGAPCTGTEYTKQFPDQARPSNRHIPTFATFCKWAAKHPLLTLNVEIKSHAEQTDLYDPPDIIVSDVVDLLERHDLHHRCIISSFDWRVLEACAERAPTVTRGHLTLEQNHGTAMVPNIVDGSPWMSGVTRKDHKDSLAQTISALGGKVWCPYFKDLTESELAKAKELGLLVNVWTVNSVSDIIRMAKMGVDGIISDYPARVQNILSQ